ncbi:nuclear receptor coactivator 7 isoform X3 [Brienomyrus brachyistius]|uniref:nuclear receptor coactivator 7 isoform X3 n=1 Tax=Brienomyrus brachyistius TaxID=42636 RepID=UPI0020B1B6FB|nr:nuclear receptor coactivator 7 isoform X3 [Brienomyrus brachyistius]
MEKERKTGYFARLKRRKHIKLNQSEPSVAKQNQAQQNHSRSLRVSALAGHRKHSPAETDKSSASMTACAEDKKTCLQEKHGVKDNHDKKDGVKKEKRGPPGTMEYTVVPQDTLNSIALKFNIMPNKLVQLNRLFSHSVVPGQTLFVPDMGQSEALSSKPMPSIPFSNDQSDKLSKDTEPIQKVQSPASEDEEPPVVKFLKMSCRYFTDGMGVVGGVLIVTPNNIMFDPHKSDPLVIENGCEEYGLICPMEEVVSIALYNDISHMKLKDALPSDLPQDLCPLYRPGEWEDLPSERDLNPFSRFEALGQDKRPIVLDAIETVIPYSTESETAEKTPSDEGFTELELPSTGNTDEWQGDTEGLEELGPPKHDSSGQPLLEACSSAPSETQMQQEELEDKEATAHSCIPAHADSLKQKTGHELQNGSGASEMAITAVTTLDLNLKETEKLEREQKCNAGASEKHGHHDSNKEAANGLKATVNGPDSKEPSIRRTSQENLQKRTSEMEMQNWLLEHMQLPIENMLLSKEEKSKNPPMFLCFRVGKPMRKSFALGQTSSPAHHYRVQGHHPEYWFAVPQERVDNLYAFFVHWSPDVYGKDAREQGFIVVEKDELDMIDNFFSSPAPKSWEIITVNEARRRQSVGSFDDDDLLYLLPTLTDNSLLLEHIHIHKLTNYLPARIQGYPWRLAYSTAVHGTSLKTLYRNMTDLDSPVLLVIKDMHNQVFGTFSSHPFRVSEHCYGTGETFLYSFCPDIRVFRWSGENSYFVKGNTDSLQIGGGKGHFGLWLDADLHHGSSRPCSTFRNQPLSAQQDFDIQDLEIWTFL